MSGGSGSNCTLSGTGRPDADVHIGCDGHIRAAVLLDAAAEVGGLGLVELHAAFGLRVRLVALLPARRRPLRRAFRLLVHLTLIGLAALGPRFAGPPVLLLLRVHRRVLVHLALGIRAVLVLLLGRRVGAILFSFISP